MQMMEIYSYAHNDHIYYRSYFIDLQFWVFKFSSKNLLNSFREDVLFDSKIIRSLFTIDLSLK